MTAAGFPVNVSRKKHLKRKYLCNTNKSRCYCDQNSRNVKYNVHNDEQENTQNNHHNRFSWIKFLNLSFAINLVHIFSYKCNVHVYYPNKNQVSHAILLIPRLCKQTVSYTYHVFFGRHHTHLVSTRWLSKGGDGRRSAIYKLLYSVCIFPFHLSPLIFLILGQARVKCSRLCRRPQSTSGKLLCQSTGWQVRCYRMIPLKSLSTAWGWANSINLPMHLRAPVLSWYVRQFNCNLSEAEVEDLNYYKNLGEFFRRNLKCGVRPIDASSPMVVPSDGQILHYGKVHDGVDGVKGVYYSLAQFLGPQTWDKNIQTSDTSGNFEDFSSHIMHHKDGTTSLFHCVIYLAPGDYHKFHSPCQWLVKFRRHFAGELLSVNPKVVKLISGLFSLNERAVYIGEWAHGFCSLTAVGATNVGSIKVYEDPDLETNVLRQEKGQYKDVFFEKPLVLNKGEKFGEFNLGSTVVLIFEAPVSFNLRLEHGMKVKVGETLVQKSHLEHQNNIPPFRKSL